MQNTIAKLEGGLRTKGLRPKKSEPGRPLISIITPVRNGEKYLEGTIKSVINQTYDNIEYIIIDGVSTDGTLDVIKKYEDYIDYWVSEPDEGMYDAINKGLKIMRGEIWACLNTDDQYNLGIIPLIVKEFNKHPEIEVVYGYLDMVDENRNFVYTAYLPKFDLKLFILTQTCWYIYQPSTFLRNRVIDRIGYFDPKYKYASDYDYLIRVAAECKMKLIRKSFTKFMVHSLSISCSEKTKAMQLKESEEIFKKYKDKFNIIQKNLFLDYLKICLIQIKLKNFKYLLKKVKRNLTTRLL